MVAYNLDEIAKVYSSFEQDNRLISNYGYLVMKQFFGSSNSCLEIGCGDGGMTHDLAAHFSRLVCIDAANAQIEKLNVLLENKTISDNCDIITKTTRIEDFEPEEKFEVIILSFVLEHVDDPVAILKKVATWLTPDGCILVVVPNGMSIHRQLGQIMGLLREVTDLNKEDIRVGHQRTYVPETLKADIAAAKLQITHFEGVLFKPLTFKQMAEIMSAKLIEACFKLGKQFPECCSSMCVRIINGQEKTTS